MAAVIPGWYGKLPALGDFASRRLPPEFVEPWDRWLAGGLATWRERDADWLDAFLAAPTWRFALGADVPFDRSPGYAGVLMPSVDRVGRYFPLTVARARASGQSNAPVDWLSALERMAVAALDEDWSAERFDSERAGLEDADDVGHEWPARGATLWWCEQDGRLTAPITNDGLPDAPALMRLFGARL
jgi:type VI secretion system protein ImpM